jgi:hypothetical protein
MHSRDLKLVLIRDITNSPPTGRCEGRKGYRDSEEGRAIVHRIRLLRRRPKRGPQPTWRQIADRLNAEGIKTLEGKEWSLYRVQQTAMRDRP